MEHGIELDAGVTNTVIQGNLIGTDATGTFAVGNGNNGGYAGIADFGASFTTIGGTTAAARNVVSGNQNAGIALYTAGTDHTLIEGNYVGTDLTGAYAIGNGQPGIDVLDQVTNTTIGGTTPGAGNLISGNVAGGSSSAITSAPALPPESSSRATTSERTRPARRRSPIPSPPRLPVLASRSIEQLTLPSAAPRPGREISSPATPGAALKSPAPRRQETRSSAT